jgi:hypothetical protein
MALVLKSARVGVEVVHTLLWLILILAVFTFAAGELLLPFGILASIPASWRIWGDCPLTALENYIYPLRGREKQKVGGRNRIGMWLRGSLGLTLRQWDYVLISLTLFLGLLYAYRVLGHMLSVPK